MQRPPQPINIGYNKSNEQYIQLLEEQNRVRKESQNAGRERSKKRIIEEKEKGFNIHINGANEERIREQRKMEMLRGASQGDSNSQQRVRRMWKNPASQERQGAKNEETKAPSQASIRAEGGGHHPKYHNPFDMRAVKPTSSGGLGNPSIQAREGSKGPRKKWGAQENTATQKTAQQIEEDYSDSFEEPNQDPVSDKDSHEEDNDAREDIEDKDDIEQFLRTATHQDIAELKNSLSNFGIAEIYFKLQ